MASVAISTTVALTAGGALTTPSSAAVEPVPTPVRATLTAPRVAAVAPTRTVPTLSLRAVSRTSASRVIRVSAGRLTTVTRFAATCPQARVLVRQGRTTVASKVGRGKVSLAGSVHAGVVRITVIGRGCRSGNRLTVTLSPTTALALAAASQSTGNQATTYSLRLSSSATRTPCAALQGATLPASAYIFVSPATGIRQVRFYVDDPLTKRAPFHVEGAAPYDLVNTNDDGSAAPLSSPSMPAGSHLVTAVVTRSTGATTVLTATAKVTAPAPTTTSPAPAPTTTARTVQVRSFGAVGNGVTDDTAALQAAIASLTPGDVLQIPAGYTFAHSDVLDIATASVRVTGGGTLLATNEARSSVWLDADGVTLDNVTLRMGTTTKRWDAYEQMKLRLTAHAGITVTNVTVDGSAAAGIFVSGASDFTLTDVTVKNTRADAIHMTGGSHDGRVVRPTTQNSGDDGVAIVSYADKPVCHHITVQSPRFYGQTWGRAFSVVGGEDVTFTDVYAERSSSASIYLATEANYDTLATKRVLVDGGTIVSANQDATVGHGAILVYSGKPGMTDSDITVRNLTIRDTRATAPRQVGVVTSNGGSVARVTFANMTLVAGPQNVFGGTAPDSAVNRTAWTWNGKAVADAIGWS